MKRLFVLLIPTALTVVGCASPAPVASNFPLSYQKVARTAHHWDVVADDVVEQTVSAIEENEALQGRPLFVAAADRPTAFNRAFREFLITRLVDSGATVSVCKSKPAEGPGFAADGNDLEVTYDTQIVAHGADVPDYQPGRYTALAGGVLVLRRLADLHFNKAEALGAGLGLGALIDMSLGNAAAPTRTEIIVTTTIAENNRFMMRRSDIYYVPDADADLFSRWGGSRKSGCPQDETAASPELQPNAVEVEKSRREMIARGMRRSNPNWQSTATPSAYSY